MTAPAPRPDGKPRLHVYKVGSRWRIGIGRRPGAFHETPTHREALAWAVSHAWR